MSTSFFRSGLFISAAMLPSALLAQASPPPTIEKSGGPGAGNEGLEEVVVTATKKARAEELQRVPAAITAFSAQQIKNTFSTNILDIGQFAPNVRFQAAGAVPGVANFSIRGMGIDSSLASDEPTVGIIVDGVYTASNYGAIVDTFDLDSIEVLRGPQGTLFGRNVTAGAVNIRTKRPTGATHLDVRMNVGNGGREEVSVAGETALAPNLYGRLSATYDTLDGLFRNRFNGERFPARRDFVVRPTLVWNPDAATTVSLIGQYSRNRDGGNTLRPLVTPGYGLQKTGYLPPTDPDVIDQDFPSTANTNVYSGTLEITRNIGNGVLTSVTGYRKVDYVAALDNDGTSINFVVNYFDIKQHQISEELRYAGTGLGGRLDYTIGFYGFDGNTRSSFVQYLPTIAVASTESIGSIREKSLAGFGQFEFRFTDQLSIVGGVRLNYDQKSAVLGYGFKTAATPTGACNIAVLPTPSCGVNFTGKKSWTDATPKIGLNWKPDRDTLAYLSFTRGFRSGGYNIRNVTVAASPGPYNPEKVDAYEAGIKRQFLQDHLRVNLTGFYNKYSDLQRSVLALTGVTTILNAAGARIWGIEFETSALVMRGLRINGSVGYLNARYDSFTGLDVNGDGKPDPDLAKALLLERAPKWTWSVSGSWDIYSGSNGSLQANAIYSYTDRNAGNVLNTVFLPAYKVLDASLRWTTEKKHFSVALYAKNLTNTSYGTTGLDASAIGRMIFYSDPRSYGIEANFHF
jgi:iron complex outermembrane receptor protein